MQHDDTLSVDLDGSKGERFNYARQCAHCGSDFRTNQPNHRFCQKACQQAEHAVVNGFAHRSKTTTPDSVIPRSTFGAVSELVACADLMQRGFHVFRAMSPSCPCDLIAWIPGGKIVRVEVKTATRNSVTGQTRFQPAIRNEFDVICHVIAPGDVVYVPPIEEW